VNIVKGQKAPVFQGWLPKYGVGDVEHYPIPTVQATGVFSGSHRSVTVLAPFDNGKPAVKAVIASDDVNDKNFTIVMADGRKVQISE